MKRTTRFIVIIIIFVVMVVGVSYAENDLPLSDRIKILKVTPYGEETKGIFEIRTDDFSYENFFRLIQERIKNGYKPDCNCDFDNEFLLSLNNRPLMMGIENKWEPPSIDFRRIVDSKKSWQNPYVFRCRLYLSDNKKFIGLCFVKIDTNADFPYDQPKHFILMNSKGDLVWEMPNEEILASTSKLSEKINFRNDLLEYRRGVCIVSNDGKVFLLKIGLRNERFGWILFDNKGKILKKSDRACCYPMFSPDGQMILVQENIDPEANTVTYPYFTCTAAYDGKGELLWRNNKVLAVNDLWYAISPSGKHIFAGTHIRDNIFDYCIVDNMGSIIATAGTPREQVDFRTRDSGVVITDDPRLFWIQGVWDKDLELVFTNISATKPIQSKYGKMVIEKLKPLSNEMFVGIGCRQSDLERDYSPFGSHKIIALTDNLGQLLGFTPIKTDQLTNRKFRIAVDKKSREVYFYSNDLFIKAKILDPGESK